VGQHTAGGLHSVMKRLLQVFELVSSALKWR
jgi:hypothetical protein